MVPEAREGRRGNKTGEKNQKRPTENSHRKSWDPCTTLSSVVCLLDPGFLREGIITGITQCRTDCFLAFLLSCFFFFLNNYLFIYLAASSFSCGMWDL